MKIIDLTHEISENFPVYPDDLNIELVKIKDLAADKYTNYYLKSGMHSGTHIDGPMHLTNSTRFISEIDIENFIGKGILINAFKQNVIEWKDQYDDLIIEESIVLIYTGHSLKLNSNEYYKNYPEITENFAKN